MSSFALPERSRRWLLYSLLFMLVARIAADIFIPLTDTTEARYAEIARKMLQTGNWITLQHDYGVPFWAKPPLSTWLAAASMALFGVNEFAVRLPSLLFGAATLALIWRWTAARRGHDFALATTAVLGSMVLFFMASGAVMTDASLTFCTTLAMISFWQALHSPDRRAGWLFFVALGIGLLAKGPVVGVLTLLPILPWLALRGQWRHAWQRLPWVGGTLLMLAIAVPWYWLAERATPGFLAYFIFGEHFGRFLHAGWAGDKYGNAHAKPFGIMFAYWFGSAFPWSLVVIAAALKRFRHWRTWLPDDSGLLSYLLLWSLAAPLFFSFSHNVIWTYALPALPAFAVLAVELLVRFRADTSGEPALSRRLVAATFATPLALLIMTVIYANPQQVLLKSSQRDTASYYLHTRPSMDSGLYYFRRRYYSAEFYSVGRARVVGFRDLDRLAQNGTLDYLVIRLHDLNAFTAEQRERFEPPLPFGEFFLLVEREATALAASAAMPSH